MTTIYFDHTIILDGLYQAHLTLPSMGFLEQPQILGGGQNVPPISYARSTCAILMKLTEIEQIDKEGAHTNF